jgi:hypothetical protein
MSAAKPPAQPARLALHKQGPGREAKDAQAQSHRRQEMTQFMEDHARQVHADEPKYQDRPMTKPEREHHRIGVGNDDDVQSGFKQAIAAM